MLNVGIIGLGVGEAHIAGYRAHPGCIVKRLCDFNQEKFEAAKLKYPEIQVVINADEILNDPDIDIVSIASYDNFHHSQIMKAIENDKHIFVEKPLCLHYHEALEIRQALNRKPDLKLSSNLILRRVPRFVELREQIRQGIYGNLFYVEGDYNYGRLHKITEGWRGKIDFYSVIYGGGIHLIDLLLWLTGEKIIEVTALGNRISSQGTDFRYNDMVVGLLKFEKGLIGKMSANFSCVHPHFHSLAIYGTKATFLNGLQEGKLFTSRDPEIQPKIISTPYPGTQKGDFLGGFVEAVLRDQQPEVSKEDVFQSMSVCFAIEKAALENQVIPVSYL